MSGFALETVQLGLYNALNADGVLSDLIQAIYDHIPDHAQYPCIVIGDGTQRDIANDATLASRLELSLHAYSKGASRKPVLSILHRLHALLHHGSLSVAEGEVIHMRVEDMETRVHTANELVEGVMRIVLLISHEEGA